MPDQHTLTEAEEATLRRVGTLPVDIGAMQAILSVYRAASACRAHLTKTALSQHQLTWTGFLVLWLLWIWGTMETRRVAQNVGISKATLTGVAKTLEARGFIERIPHERDRRLVELNLTQAGQDLMAGLFPEFNAAETSLVSGIEADDLHTLVATLRQIVITAEGEAS
jgi:MarR family transcriptional regulator, organic hydroperoxide resistance regulator